MTDHRDTVENPHPEHITGGVDTHKKTHVAAARDGLGRLLGTATFPATTTGYRAALAWLRGLGTLVAVGIEGTNSYGKGLTRYLTDHGVTVIEVNRPDRATRRRKGKSDTQDAINAAAMVQSGDATATPKAATGPAAAAAVLRTVRASAVKSRTVTRNQLQSLVTTAPAELRERLDTLGGEELLTACTRLRPGTDLADPVTATKTALRRLARRIHALTAEIADADAELGPVLAQALPQTLALFGVGPDSAGQLLVTAGDNPARIATEAQFAHLCGVAPIEASSGNTSSRRLNRGGDRHANAALYRIAIVRMRYCPTTRAYVARRTTEGKSKRHIIRCLKRYIARELYKILTHPKTQTTPTKDLATAA
jgi:transposase